MAKKKRDERSQEERQPTQPPLPDSHPQQQQEAASAEEATHPTHHLIPPPPVHPAVCLSSPGPALALAPAPAPAPASDGSLSGPQRPLSAVAGEGVVTQDPVADCESFEMAAGKAESQNRSDEHSVGGIGGSLERARDGEPMDANRGGLESLVRVVKEMEVVREPVEASVDGFSEAAVASDEAQKGSRIGNGAFADNSQLSEKLENGLCHLAAVHDTDTALAEEDELKQNKFQRISEIHSNEGMAGEGCVDLTVDLRNPKSFNFREDDETDTQTVRTEDNPLEATDEQKVQIENNGISYLDDEGSKAESNPEEEPEAKGVLDKEQLQQLKVLLKALALISRDVPLSGPLLKAVINIYQSKSTSYLHKDKATPISPSATQNQVHKEKGALLDNFEMAIASQRSKFMSAAVLRKEGEYRMQSRLNHRLQELEDIPWHLGTDVDRRCYVELQSLKLLGLQKKIRSEVAAEHHLRQLNPEKHLLDWGLMRLRRHYSLMYGGAHSSNLAPSNEADERLRRKRELERQRRLEEEERTRMATRKRKFFSELLNFVREFQLQGQAASKFQKQRNDGVQTWHAKQRQRATRAEKMRFQALKADDEEAYMKMVEESKNERLMTLLSKTDDLLQRLGAMVQRQKDSKPEVNFKKEKHKEKSREHPRDTPELASPRLRNKEAGLQGANVISPRSRDGKDSKQAWPAQEEENYEDVDFEASGKKRDLLEGQRQYNSAVHKIEEKVTEQPSILEGGQLRSYQLDGLQWMLSLYNNNLNGILADEMGLGKTIQTISLLAYLMENKGVTGPHMIIAPKAVLPNWAHEFATWAPSVITVVYDGRAEERKLLREDYGRDGRFNVLVTHYDLIMRDRAFLKKIHWHYMVVDEGHRLKNHDCMFSRTLAGGYHMRRRLLLTGTPIQNSLQELWSLLNFLLPAIFNSSQNFEDWFNAPFADRAEVSLTDEEQLLVIRRLHQVIRPFLLRRKKSEVEKFLPGKTQVILKCDLSAWQRIYYQQIIELGRVGLDAGKVKGLQNTAMQLRKCCNHPYLFLEKFEYEARQENEIVRSSGKFELLDRLLPKLARAGHRVLLFSQMTRLIDIMERYLNWHGFKYLRLDGSTKTEERGLLLQEFNAPDSPYFMFLLSTRAGGLGLNLQSADTVILFDSDWNPQVDQQAEDRAHRIGQKKEVRVFVLVSVGSIEEEILDRAKSKMGIDAKVIQAGLFNTTSTAQERREMLEEIMRKGTNALSTDVPSEREINRLVARSDEEFRLFEDMDEERRNEEEYRSRLIEEHEVPDWVFFQPENLKAGKHDFANQVQGKRQRKEVLYTDALSDSQWLKAVEDGQDVLEVVKSQKEKRARQKGEFPVPDVDLSMSAYNSTDRLILDLNPSKRDVNAQHNMLAFSDNVASDADENQRGTSHFESDASIEVQAETPRPPYHSSSPNDSSNAQGTTSDSFANFDMAMHWRGLRRKRSRQADAGDEANQRVRLVGTSHQNFHLKNHNARFF